jgi:hypothetical protein
MSDHDYNINLTHLIASNKFHVMHINIAIFYGLPIKLPLWLHCISIKLMIAIYALMHITAVRSSHTDAHMWADKYWWQ